MDQHVFRVAAATIVRSKYVRGHEYGASPEYPEAVNSEADQRTLSSQPPPGGVAIQGRRHGAAGLDRHAAALLAMTVSSHSPYNDSGY
jgi:hypothetical protein